MKRERIYPPNCTVCDLNPSRFLAFREKQRAVEAEYGFRLCVPRRTQEQRDGYRRYIRDYRRRYQEAHKEQRKAYRHAYWVKVTKRGFDSLAEANGDVAELKRRAEKKAAKAKRAEYEARKLEIHAKYGFWLNTCPKTPDEEAGRARYIAERDAAYKLKNREHIVKWQKEHNARRRIECERRFQEKLKRLAAKDPVAAEKFKAKHEKLVRIQNMTHEERVRYRQQKQFDKLKAQAEREEARKKAREEAAKERKSRTVPIKQLSSAERKRRKAEQRARLIALNAERAAKAAEERRKAKEAARLEAKLERESAAAALVEAERNTAAAFASEREANRAAYLAAKAAKKDEGWGMRGEKEARVLDTSLTEFTELREESPAPPVTPVPEVPPPPAINIAEYLPHHPFRGLLLEDTAPTDEEVAGDAVTPGYGYYTADDSSPSPIPHFPSLSSGGKPPQVPPSVATGGEPPEDDDDDWRRREREEKIRRIREQYGFTLGVKPVTPEEIEGKKRYIADRNRETAVRNREIDYMLHGKERIRKAAAKKRKATIARKKREAAAQAAREAKAAERAAQTKAREEARLAAREAKRAAKEAEAAAKTERKALLEQAYSTFRYKVTAYERKKAKMRRQLGLPKMKSDFTPEQKERWNTYLRKSRAELENWLVERMRKVVAKEVAKAAKTQKATEAASPKVAQRRGRPPLPAEVIAARDARIKERAERKRLIFEKYGFTLGKKPMTPEEIEGRKRYDRDMLAAERERNREKIRAYQKAYSKIRAARRLAEAQTKWSPEQWAEWNARQAAKECPPGSPQWLVREVVKYLAQENNLPEDAVMERIIELGGLDFLIKGAESMGMQRCHNKRTVFAAAHALALYLDPEKAEMFSKKETENGELGTGNDE